MSIQMLTWALEQRTGSVSRKAVLLALANCHNHHTGLCCPGLRQLRKETELSESTVLRSLTELEDAGFIQREQRQRPNGSHTTTVYRFPHSEGGFPQGGGTPSPRVGDLEPEVRTGREPTSAEKPKNEIWDALAVIFGEPTTRPAQRERGQIVRDLTEAGATPEDIYARSKRWAKHFDHATLTAHALVKHWDTLPLTPRRVPR